MCILYVQAPNVPLRDMRADANPLTMAIQENPRQQVLCAHAENKLDSEVSAPAQLCVLQAESAAVSRGPTQVCAMHRFVRVSTASGTIYFYCKTKVS